MFSPTEISYNEIPGFDLYFECACAKNSKYEKNLREIFYNCFLFFFN